MAVLTTEETAQEQPKSAFAGIKYWKAALVVFVAVVATGLPQPGIIGRLPLNSLLMGRLHESQTRVSTFFLLAAIPWLLVKPVFGLVSDAFPIFGTRRRHYLLLSSVLAAATWIAFIWVPHRYGALLAACLVVNVFMAFGSTVASAVMVDAGRGLGALGRLTSVRVAAECVIGVFQGPLGGLFAGLGLSMMAGANVAIVLTLVPITYLFVRERPQTIRNLRPFTDAGQQVKTLFASKTVWLVLLITLLFYFSPGFATVQYFRQKNQFGLSDLGIGYLTGIASVFGLLMALSYSALCRKWRLKTLLIPGIAFLAASNFLYLLYSKEFGRDAFIDAQSAFFYTLCEVGLYTLAARATPVGCEGMGFSLLVGFRNLCLMVADVVGSSMMDHKMQFWQLLAISSGTTLCVLFVLPFLPDTLLRAKDRRDEIPEQNLSPAVA